VDFSGHMGSIQGWQNLESGLKVQMAGYTFENTGSTDNNPDYFYSDDVYVVYKKVTPVVDYMFLSGGSVAYDSSGNSTNGALQYDASMGSNPPSVAFDGADDYIAVAASSDFEIKDVSTKPFTMSAWLYPDASTNHTVFSVGTSDYNSFSFLIEDTEKLWVVGDTNGTGDWDILNTSTGVITLNTFSHIVLTRDTSGNHKFYINGSDAGGGFTVASDIYTNNNSVKIGGHYSLTAGYNTNGKIDEPRISTTARSANWITTEYNNQSATSTFYTLGSQETRGTGTRLRLK